MTTASTQGARQTRADATRIPVAREYTGPATTHTLNLGDARQLGWISARRLTEALAWNDYTALSLGGAELLARIRPRGVGSNVDAVRTVSQAFTTLRSAFGAANAACGPASNAAPEVLNKR